MTDQDVRNIFSDNVEGDQIITGKRRSVSIKSFLDIAGFRDAPDNPSKDDLHAIDGGVKGYSELIESGIYK